MPRRPRSFGIGVVLVLGLLAAPQPITAQLPATFEHGRAPLRTMERNPVYRLFHTPAAEAGDVVGSGEVRIEVASAYSNLLEYIRTPESSATVDMERWTNTVELRWGFADGWEAGARIGSRTSWGGFLDPFIQWWHARFGLPNGDREAVEDNEFSFAVTRNGRLIVLRPSGTRLEDPTLTLGRRIAGGAGEDHALAARLSTKLPLGASASSTGRTDWAVQFDGRRSLGIWHLHGGLGVVSVRADTVLDPFTHDAAWFGHATIERELGPVSGFLQFQGGGPYLKDLGSRELNRGPFNFAFGAAGGLAGWRWEASFVEDIRADDPSVDFTLDLRLQRTF